MAKPDDRDLSFDPRTWLARTAKPAAPPPVRARDRARVRIVVAATAGCAILAAGAATAYFTRDNGPRTAVAPLR